MNIRSKQIWLVAAVGVGLGSALLGAGCKMKSNSGDGARVRLINAAPNADGLTVSVNGDRAWKNAAYRSNSGYQTIAAGTYPVRMDAAKLGAVPARSLSFEKGHAYTVLALGPDIRGAGPGLEVFEDGAASPAAGRAALRFVNASTNGIPLDLAVNSIVAAKGVTFGGGSAALTLDGGAYDLQVVAYGTADVLAGPVSLRLEPGRTYTLVAMGDPSDGSLSLEAYPDAK